MTRAGQLYSQALTVALDDPDPAARARAGRLMSRTAAAMKQPDVDREHSASLQNASLRELIRAAMNHRIYGS